MKKKIWLHYNLDLTGKVKKCPKLLLNSFRGIVDLDLRRKGEVHNEHSMAEFTRKTTVSREYNVFDQSMVCRVFSFRQHGSCLFKAEIGNLLVDTKLMNGPLSALQDKDKDKDVTRFCVCTPTFIGLYKREILPPMYARTIGYIIR